jgi:flavorubredoxin
MLDNLKKLSALKVSLLAPSHGIVWRRHISEIVSRYQDWGAFKPRPKVLIVYDSMWGSTEAMAEAVAAGASLAGVEVKLTSLRRTDLTWFATEALDAAAIAVGSATLNQGMLPAVAAALTYLEGLKPRHKAAFAFGSSGWAKGGADGVEARLKAMGLDVLRPALFASYAPTRAVLDECRAAGEALGQRALPQAQ